MNRLVEESLNKAPVNIDFKALTRTLKTKERTATVIMNPYKNEVSFTFWYHHEKLTCEVIERVRSYFRDLNLTLLTWNDNRPKNTFVIKVRI